MYVHVRLSPADALKLWARLCCQCVLGSLLPVDALKLWARFRRQLSLVICRPPAYRQPML